MATLKCHYGLWFGSLAGVLPYTALIASQYAGATATQIGILYTLLPFVALVAKPMFCSLADRYNAHRLVLIASLVTTLIGYAVLGFAPFQHNAQVIFWCLFVAIVIANASMGIVISLTDSLVMREVTLNSGSYGAFRLFGTLGWGIFGLLAGLINDSQVVNVPLPYLLPGIIMFIIMIIVDIVMIWMNLKQPPVSVNHVPLSTSGEEKINQHINDQVWTHVRRTFRAYPKLSHHCLVVVLVGLLTSFHWTYFFLFLEGLNGQDTLLMGLTLVIQCFFGELPFFAMAQRIINKLGHSNALMLVVVSFCVRYLCYGLLIVDKSRAYYVLLVELLQGPSIGLFYCLIASIAQHYALLGSQLANYQLAGTSNTEIDVNGKTFATMQGIMSACFEGLGLGLGSLIGGIVLDHFGARSMWLIAAGYAVLVILVSTLLRIFIRTVFSSTTQRQ